MLTQKVTINLKEGWAEDGFGTRDKVSGARIFMEVDLVVHFMEQMIMKNSLLMEGITYSIWVWRR